MGGCYENEAWLSGSGLGSYYSKHEMSAFIYRHRNQFSWSGFG